MTYEIHSPKIEAECPRHLRNKSAMEIVEYLRTHFKVDYNDHQKPLNKSTEYMQGLFKRLCLLVITTAAPLKPGQRGNDMTTEQIKKIQEEYQRQGNHSVVQGIFDLSAVQEYAINVFGRDKEVPAEVLAARFDQLKDGMSIGDVAIALGYPAEASIS